MIVFERVSVDFGTTKAAVADLSFEVQKGETLVLLGKSGSGKTTALRLINQMIEPTSGTIYFEGKPLSSLDPIAHRRNIGYALQHIGLFLHMSVGENIAIVPKLLGWDKTKIDQRVEELLEIIGLDPRVYQEMMPGALSGGQKQRIGVARALAADPSLILMDEPFGALDPISREQLQNEFLEIQAQIHKTVVFVTHDLSEAVKMGDRIAVFEEGKIVQIATPKELIERPATSSIDSLFEKDRFQLLLQMQTLDELTLQYEIGEKKEPISVNTSVLDALARSSASFSVYEGKKYLGNISRKQLLESLIHAKNHP